MVSPRIDGYKFGNKNNWRRTIWNEVSKRVGASKRDSLVLYLAGKDDLDRPVACKKGFSNRNLIAVDANALVSSHLRRQGKIVLRCDFAGAIASWPKSKPLGVIMADFCCGIERSIFERFINALLVGPLVAGATVMVNLQRGRDAYYARNFSATIAEFGKNRAEAFLLIVCSALLFYRTDWYLNMPDEEKPAVRARLLGLMYPAFYSYKSQRVTMDSVIFGWPLPTQTASVQMLGGFESLGLEDCRRFTNAALAVHTKKTARG